jgi:phosphate transport system permease protein
MSENIKNINSEDKSEIDIKLSLVEDREINIPEVSSRVDEEKKIFKKESSFADISLKKKFRLSEFLAEKIITSVAFLSIAIILLIFIFVFRESLPIFISGENSSKKELNGSLVSKQNENSNNVEKSVNSDPVKNGDIQKPEQYGVSTEKPEQYGVNTEKPEQYGVSPEKPEQYGVSAEKPEQYGVSTEKPEQYGVSTKKPEQYGVTTQKLKDEKKVNKNSEKNGETPVSVQSTDLSSFEQGKLSSSNTESSGREGTADLKNLTGAEWQPVSDNPRYGLLPLFFGTFKLTLIAILIAAPIGILAALFTASFAPKWLKEIIKPAIEILAGFPSVVIGFFALMVMATFFQDMFGYGSRLNGFVGGVAMSLAAIPIIYTITEDALTAVPQSYKEASLALGATTWQTAFFVTLPAATPGIFAAVLLGVGRVFGETMIALMATGNASLFNMNPFDSVRALSATIGAEMAEVVFGDTHYNVLFLIGSLLFIFTFILNVIAEFYVRGKLVKKFQGGKA